MLAKLTYIGHATILVEDEKSRFITDPLLVKRIARIGPKRRVPFEMNTDWLRGMDFITVSHGHFDHLDLRSIRMFPRSVPVVCHPTLQRIAKKTRHKPVPLGWWDTVEIGGVKVSAVPSFHFSARPPLHWSLDYQGYVVEGGKTYYHAGDAGASPYFKEIGRKFKIDIAMIPIGAYNPKSFRKHHLSPEDALEAFVELGAKILIPMHWGTFNLSWEPFGEPPQRLMEHARKMGIEDKVRLLQPAASIEV